MGRFTGQTVVVTGASRGLGRDIAVAFGREGAFVQVCYRTGADRAAETLALVRAAGGEGAACSFDVRDGDAVRAAMDDVLAVRGKVDVLINNAGVVNDAPFAIMERTAFDEVIDTNLRGTFLCCRAALGAMMAQRRGAIINVASVSGLRASPGQSNYAASKGGVLAFTATLAAECAARGVRVNAVVPGMLTTGMAVRADPRALRELTTRIPAARFGTGAEVAAVVLFLASEEASYVIGQSIVVDGGLSA
jgi:3-oxoacyl-[acyl-carrier protein] reductase